MSEFKLTKKAVIDLTRIWNYTYDNWSEQQADNYYNQIIKLCNKLSVNPEIGKDYFSLIEGLKGLKVNRHIIFYRQVTEDQIEIERVLHERMDLKARLEE